MADYDVAIIGSGPGGYVAAIRAGQLGGKACVIDNRELGGVCLNRGCIPTKILLHAADILREAGKGPDYGITFGQPSIDYSKLVKTRDSIVAKLRQGVAGLLRKNKVEFIQGTAAIEAVGKVKVISPQGDRTISAANIIIATGAEPARPGFLPIDGKKIITSDELMTLDHIPSSMIVIGGGYIGCEYAAFYAAMGTKVTIVEMLDQLIPMLDTDIAAELTRNLKKAGLDIYTSSKAEDLKATDKGVSCRVGDKTIEAELALVAIGRKLNSDMPGIKELGIAVEKNAIVIDDKCRTNIDGIYAIGDVTGKIQLAHVASAQGIVAAENIMGHPRAMSYRVVPAAIFSHPQIATVGMGEKDAAAQQIEVKVSKFNFRGLGKAMVIGDTTGYVKLIGHAKTGELLGCQMIGPNTTELIEEVAVAIKLQSTVEEVARTIHPHPTLSESVMEAAESWMGLGIHS
ncbi:MAG TPA: dihydrolipoyl dehydrogenase [Planctomycetota bacterium]|nr:dihydrolipoyl dehydrogenase [Planctomycetota bacterium]